MTTAVSRAPGTASRVAVRSWKAPIAFGIFSLLAVILFVALGRDRRREELVAVDEGERAVAVPFDLVGPTGIVGRELAQRGLHRGDGKLQRHDASVPDRQWARSLVAAPEVMK